MAETMTTAELQAEFNERLETAIAEGAAQRAILGDSIATMRRAPPATPFILKYATFSGVAVTLVTVVFLAGQTFQRWNNLDNQFTVLASRVTSLEIRVDDTNLIQVSLDLAELKGEVAALTARRPYNPGVSLPASRGSR